MGGEGAALGVADPDVRAVVGLTGAALAPLSSGLPHGRAAETLFRSAVSGGHCWFCPAFLGFPAKKLRRELYFSLAL